MPGLFDRLQEEITHQDKVAGMSTVDLLDMEDGARQIVQLLMRRGELSLAAIAEALGPEGQDLEALATRLQDVVGQGFILRRDRDGEAFYHTAFGRRRRQALPLDLWAMLADRADEPAMPEDTDGAQGADGP